VTVDFHKAMQELGELGMVNLQEVEPAELISMACAVAKHRAIDQYLLSIGVDPHAGVQPRRWVTSTPAPPTWTKTSCG